LTLSVAVVFGIVVVAFGLFVSERVPVSQVALGIPAALIATGVLTPTQAVSGFSAEPTVTVAAMLVLSQALSQTGAVRDLAVAARSIQFLGPRGRLMLFTVVAALVSPFVNNTAVVLVFLPLFVTLAREDGQSPSLYLMPLSFSAILGGTITMIGTSTNLVVSGLASRQGIELGIFSTTPLGLTVAVVGMVYLWTIGRWLLPHRTTIAELQGYGRRFLADLAIQEDSPLVGRTRPDLDWSARFGVDVIGVRRARSRAVLSGANVLHPGDVLSVVGDIQAFLELDHEQRAALVRRDPREGARMVEVLLGPGAPLVGRSLRSSHFEDVYDCTVLGVQQAQASTTRMVDATLRAGDILLVEGPPDILDALVRGIGLVGLQEVETRGPRRGRLFALSILLLVVLAAGSGTTSILAASVVGAVAVVYFGCVQMRDLYEGLDWGVLILLAGTLPLGLAMDESGAAALLASGLAGVAQDAPPVVVVAVLYGITSVLTEVMSNNAAAILLAPIALRLAERLDLPPEMLLITIMFGASASFMSPVGYQTNTMVYGPGGYRFSDYLRVGGPLNLLLLVVVSWFVTWWWA